MKQDKLFWLVSVLIILTVPGGCVGSAQLKQCQSDIYKLDAEKTALLNEVQALKRSVDQLTKRVSDLEFERDILRKEVLALKTAGPQPTSTEVIDRLVEQLRGPESEIPAIIKQLRNYGKPAVIALVMRLKEAEITFHRRLEQALEQMVPAEAVPVLIDALKKPEVRNSAARVLGNLKDRSAVIHLAEYLKDEDANFVFNVGESLVKLRDRRGLPVLIENLKSHNSARRALSFDTLSKTTGLTFDFAPHKAPEENTAAIQKWELWWSKEGDKFEFKE